MATLTITADPSDDLRRYKLAIDGKRVKMRANNKGTHVLDENACGDRTEHRLGYSLVGPAGAALAIKMVCDDDHEIAIKDVKVSPEGAPLGGGNVRFKL